MPPPEHEFEFPQTLRIDTWGTDAYCWLASDVAGNTLVLISEYESNLPTDFETVEFLDMGGLMDLCAQMNPLCSDVHVRDLDRTIADRFRASHRLPFDRESWLAENLFCAVRGFALAQMSDYAYGLPALSYIPGAFRQFESLPAVWRKHCSRCMANINLGSILNSECKQPYRMGEPNWTIVDWTSYAARNGPKSPDPRASQTQSERQLSAGGAKVHTGASPAPDGE